MPCDIFRRIRSCTHCATRPSVGPLMRACRAFQQDTVNSTSAVPYRWPHGNRSETLRRRDGRLAGGRGLHPVLPGPRAVRARGLAEREGRALPRLGAGRPAEAVGGARACPAGGAADGRRQRRVAGPFARVSRQAAVLPARRSRRGRGGSGARRGEGPGPPSDGHAPSEGRRGLSRRAPPLLDPPVGVRPPRRVHRRRRCR